MKNILIIFLCLFTSTLFAQHVYPQASGGGSSFNIISTSQLTAAANDWNPAGLSTASLIRLSGDNQFRIISGITAPASPKQLALMNTGPDFPVLLTKEDGASTAANRFSTSRDIPLYPGQTATFFYDDTDDRWKFVSLSNQGNIFSSKEAGATFLSTGSVTTGDYDHWIFTAASGTFTSIAPTATAPRCVRVGTSTSATAAPSIQQKGAAVYLGKTSTTPNANFVRVVLSNINTLSDGTDTYRIVAGSPASLSGASPDGAYFKYEHAANGGRWQCVTRTAATETSTDSGVTVAINTKYVLEVFHRPDNSVAFFINGAFVAENTTNVHDGFGYCNVYIQKSVGTATRQFELFSMEYVESRI